jgi:hypothetical protein
LELLDALEELLPLFGHNLELVEGKASHKFVDVAESAADLLPVAAGAGDLF